MILPAMPTSNFEFLQAQLRRLLGDYKATIPSTVAISTEPSAHATNVFCITLTAKCQLNKLSTRHMDQPRVYIAWCPHQSSDATRPYFLGFQCCEFALPVRASDASLDFDFFDRPGFVRPRCVFPIIVMSKVSEDCLMLAPFDSFHYQVVAVVDNEFGQRELRWGWSGDMDTLPEAFSTTLAVICGSSPRELMKTWGTLIRDGARARGVAVNSCGRYADTSVAKLSMWTDNGASYWYRFEKDMDLPSTLEATMAHLDKHNVPIGSVEFDSWFYPHEITRPVTDVGYPNIVPPTGMLRWEPRHDVLGEESIKTLRERLGNRPLILHSRHISSKSTYITDPFLKEDDWWIDKDRAHPAGPALFQRWMQQAVDWGATAYEQDWLVEVWLGVRQLRERPGRIETWQHQLNIAAKEHNLSLIWCMATPADMAHAVSLSQIVAVRSCDDYRYAKDPSILWVWHLIVSGLIRSLGLFPFKDIFMSHGNGSILPDINGDPNAELEACLSALSAGPVGIGDRVGRTNVDLVRKTCRSDGVLIKPDLPLAAMDRSIRDPSGLLWAETNSGMWRYIVAIRTGIRTSGDVSNEVPLTETLALDSSTSVLAYNWKSKEASVVTSLTASLRLHEWMFWVVCPIIGTSTAVCPFALIGDSNAIVTMGDRRIRTKPDAMPADKFLFEVIGVKDEDVQISFWSGIGGLQSKRVSIPAKGWIHCSLQLDPSENIVLVTEESS